MAESWCEKCGLPPGHGRCPGCIGLRYPDGKGGVDWTAAWLAEGDVEKLPPGIRDAARRYTEAVREERAGEDWEAH